MKEVKVESPAKDKKDARRVSAAFKVPQFGNAPQRRTEDGHDATALGGPPIIEGDVFRGGDVVSQFITPRYMQLLENCIVQHKTKQNMVDKAKHKVFSLDGTCTVSVVYEEELMLRPKGTGTVQALVMSSYEKRMLHVFTIRWVPSISHSWSDHLLLGFSSAEEAQKWRDEVQACIDKLPARKLPRDQALSARGESSKTIGSPTASYLYGGSPPKDERLLRPRQDSESSENAGGPEKDNPHSSSPKNASEESQGGLWVDRGQWPSRWVSHSFYNGISVYREQQQDGGAYMCSVAIRASPREVFAAVQKFEVGFNSILKNVTVLESFKDDNTQIIHCDICPDGVMASFFGKRDLVAQRSWRVEDDGTYVVTLSSVEHPLCPPPKPKSGFSWLSSSVRAEVIAAGFTIAPLKPQFLPADLDPRDSPETLLTIVMSLDVGGSVNWFGGASRQQLESIWMWPLVTSVAGVRERMEQTRFVGTHLMMDEEAKKGNGSSNKKKQKAPEQSAAPDASGTSTDPANSTAATDTSAVREEISKLIMDRSYWNCPGIADYKVRGKDYLTDRKKFVSEEPAFPLDSLFLLKLDGITENIAQYLLPPDVPGFTFVVNIMVPTNDHLVMFWNDRNATEHPEQDEDGPTTPFNTCLARFLFGDGPTFDGQRNGTFKLIPHVVEGSWVIKQSVGATPVLLGNKLRQAYHRGPNYFEVDIDIGSSRTARNVVGLVAGTTKTVVVDMGILMEGHTEDELPERLLGTVQLDRIDMDKATRVTQSQLDALQAMIRKDQ